MPVFIIQGIMQFQWHSVSWVLPQHNREKYGSFVSQLGDNYLRGNVHDQNVMLKPFWMGKAGLEHNLGMKILCFLEKQLFNDSLSFCHKAHTLLLYTVASKICFCTSVWYQVEKVQNVA